METKRMMIHLVHFRKEYLRHIPTILTLMVILIKEVHIPTIQLIY